MKFPVILAINFVMAGSAAGLSFCTGGDRKPVELLPADSEIVFVKGPTSSYSIPPVQDQGPITTGKINPGKLISFSKSLVGVPYKYGSSDPAAGFDCSGFISYVFNHFGIRVPRSSVEFTNVGKPVRPRDSKAGDLILFTGTDSTIRVVGHMGIITQNTGDSITFIHSTSGKAYGVTETPLNLYYQGRFVKVIRVF